MTNVSIKISINELSHYSTSIGSLLEDKTLLSLVIKAFASHIKNLYGQMIEEEIHANRYKGKWEPVDDEGYREYLGVTPTGYILEYIRDALEVVKKGTNYIVQIDPHYKYPGTKIPLVRVVRAIDSGTSKFNAHPIMRKIILRINSHLLTLWKSYLMQKGVV